MPPAFPAIGRCSALNELSVALYVRGFGRVAFPARYAAFDALLDTSPCRARRLREAWRSTDAELPVDGHAYCTAGATPGADCGVPDFVVFLPFVRFGVGQVLAASTAPDWFKQYAAHQ
jgi:hypothetical protein